MKPLNDSEQSRRVLRWIKYGSVVGLALAAIRLIVIDSGATFWWADGEGLSVNAFNFALFIFLSGAAGGLMAMIANWKKR